MIKLIRIGLMVITVLLTVAAFGALPFAVHSEYVLANAQASVQIQVTQTIQERIAVLQAWKEQHQKADDDQFKEIRELQTQLAATAISNEHRITVLEHQEMVIKEQFDSLTTKMWAVIFAVFAQLLHLASQFVDRIKARRNGKTP